MEIKLFIQIFRLEKYQATLQTEIYQLSIIMLPLRDKIKIIKLY